MSINFCAIFTVNKNMVPFDDKSLFVTSGIRTRVVVVTTRRLKEKDMKKVVFLPDSEISNFDNDKKLGSIFNEENKMMSGLPLFILKIRLCSAYLLLIKEY